MSFLGSEKLKIFIKRHNVISTFDERRIKAGAYELALGGEVFRTDSKDKKKEFFFKDNDQVVINPGQFALLLSSERLNIPQDKIGFISIKAGIKLRGLVNVSGFHVDPGFKGKLLFSVYNAGSGPISLLVGEPCFLIWFSDLQLEPGETDSYAAENHGHNGQETIKSTYIDHLLQSEVASPNALKQKIDDNFHALNVRLATIEKEQTAKDYLIKTALGLGIIILVKFLFDWSSYDNGFKEGINKKTELYKLDSAINQLRIEREAMQAPDSQRMTKNVNGQ